MARSTGRWSRARTGAGRMAIARGFLVESLLLTTMGALLGLVVAWAALKTTNFYLAKMLPQSLPASLDWRVLGFAAALTVVVGVVIGLVPGCLTAEQHGDRNGNEEVALHQV